MYYSCRTGVFRVFLRMCLGRYSTAAAPEAYFLNSSSLSSQLMLWLPSIHHGSPAQTGFQIFIFNSPTWKLTRLGYIKVSMTNWTHNLPAIPGHPVELSFQCMAPSSIQVLKSEIINLDTCPTHISNVIHHQIPLTFLTKSLSNSSMSHFHLYHPSQSFLLLRQLHQWSSI